MRRYPKGLRHPCLFTLVERADSLVLPVPPLFGSQTIPVKQSRPVRRNQKLYRKTSQNNGLFFLFILKGTGSSNRTLEFCAVEVLSEIGSLKEQVLTRHLFFFLSYLARRDGGNICRHPSTPTKNTQREKKASFNGQANIGEVLPSHDKRKEATSALILADNT